MSTIAENLQSLQNDKTAISDAIVAKGGTIAEGDGFNDFASAIETIPTYLSGSIISTETLTTLTISNLLAEPKSVMLWSPTSSVPTDDNIYNVMDLIYAKDGFVVGSAKILATMCAKTTLNVSALRSTNLVVIESSNNTNHIFTYNDGSFTIDIATVSSGKPKFESNKEIMWFVMY